MINYNSNLPVGPPSDFLDEKCPICNSATRCKHDSLSVDEIREILEARKENKYSNEL